MNRDRGERWGVGLLDGWTCLAAGNSGQSDDGRQRKHEFLFHGSVLPSKSKTKGEESSEVKPELFAVEIPVYRNVYR